LTVSAQAVSFERRTAEVIRARHARHSVAVNRESERSMTTQPPGPGAIRFVLGVRRRGFLTFAGELWREHGDVFQVRVGSRRLVFAIHPDAVDQVTVKRSKKYDKVDSYEPVRKYLLGEGLVASTGELWRRQRKLMAPFFTPSGIQVYAERMLRDALTLADRWDGLAQSGEAVEISEEMTRVTASIILRTMFSSENFDDIVRMKNAVETIVGFGNGRMAGLPIPVWIPTAKNRRYRAAKRFVHRSISELIAERRAMDEADWPEDLLARLMSARDDETGHTMSETLLRDEAITIFFAGHETTARTLTFAWYALAANPDIAGRLREELDEVLGGHAPTVEDLHELPYTLRVIKEVLRLYPAAPFYVRDAVEDDEIDGFHVPSGTAVMLSPYYTHRHPDFWENPDVFDPDRWTPEREKARHRRAYHPFASGARICIGNNFSLLESHLLLAVLAQRFAPRLAGDYTPRWEMQGVLSLADGLPMAIEAR